MNMESMHIRSYRSFKVDEHVPAQAAERYSDGRPRSGLKPPRRDRRRGSTKDRSPEGTFLNCFDIVATEAHPQVMLRQLTVFRRASAWTKIWRSPRTRPEDY